MSDDQQGPRRLTVDDLYTFAVPEAPTISPDGDTVVYVLRTLDREEDSTVRALWQVDAHAGGARQLTYGTADTAPVFSPDGRTIAFLRAPDGPAQLWSLPAAGGDSQQLTTLPLGAGAPVWSPDGTRLAFTAPVDTVAGPDEDGATRERRAGAPIVADRLDYQADGAGLLRTMRKHVHVYQLASRETRQVTSGDWHAGDPAWSPDGTQLAFPAATDADADLTLHSAVQVLDLTADHPDPRPVGPVDGAMGSMVWTADGRALLVIGVRGKPNLPAGLLRIPLHGGPVVELAAPLDRTVVPGAPGYPGSPPQLTPDGRTVLFCVGDHGDTHLYAVDIDNGTPRLVLGQAGTKVCGTSVARQAPRLALVSATPTSFGEIAMVDLGTRGDTAAGTAAVLTSHGESGLERIDLIEHTGREFTVSDGTVVAGWLVRDPGADRPGPLLLDVHGGPHGAWGAAADQIRLYHQILAARGWTVLLVNPRGSDGYGAEFFSAVDGGWGRADSRDLLEPLEELVADGIADPTRLAVAGYSYGGFMTCYLTSRDDRFAAAVTGGVVGDLASLTGTSDAGRFLSAYELGGASYEDRDGYDAMSPLACAGEARTPTLILQGATDLRCPIGQAQQWFTALREQGVPARLVLYPDGSHQFPYEGPPSHRADFNQRIIDWVEQYAGDAAGPRRAPINAEHWQRRLSFLAARHHVPGATLGILRVHPGRDDELVQAACGVLNVDTGVEVTTDSLFQIGSITKVWTATVALQLVDEGLLDLDAPIVDMLPELQLSDPDVTKRVTMRHLLTHTSGIDGDIFTDTGRGDDCVERFVALLSEVAQNHPLGATWSYCNAGFVLAGRVIEKLTDSTWDQALRDRLFTPLGLAHTVTLPEQALLFRTAAGHVAEGETEPQLAPVWGLPRSVGPAGVISSTVADVLAFARLHLDGGRAADGTRVLAEGSAAAMADKHAELPDTLTLGDSWGLGWIRFGWDGHRLIGHDGNTIGQAAFLRVLPEEGLAVTLLTNGGQTRDLYEDLYREIFAELADVAMPQPLTPPDPAPGVDVQPYLGTYERASTHIEILLRDGGAVMRTTATGPLAELMAEPMQEFAMAPVADGLFAIRAPGAQTWTPVTFYRLPTGEPYLHVGVRATPKVS